MKTRRETFSPRVGRVGDNAPYLASFGFTLLEMIGVLAVMAILAATLVPNVLKSIERAAVRAEADTLRALGEQVKLYLRDNAVPPTTAAPPANPNWTTQLATYASLNSADILTNRRQMNRLYVVDPIAANQRALLLSSMRNGVALPNYAQVSGNFANIWDTLEGAVPAGAGWGAWNANNIEFLVIERVNLAPVYRNELQAFTLSLNNPTATVASYQITRANGGVQPVVPVPANSSQLITPVYPKDRVALYRSAGGVNLVYTYVVSTSGKVFDFNGTNWTPQ